MLPLCKNPARQIEMKGENIEVNYANTALSGWIKYLQSKNSKDRWIFLDIGTTKPTLHILSYPEENLL